MTLLLIVAAFLFSPNIAGDSQNISADKTSI
ncbi:hypothetical protein Bresa_03563|nr:hypothetical protein [Brenneria salicis ATCC 15712 = DSM 30166]